MWSGSSGTGKTSCGGSSSMPEEAKDSPQNLAVTALGLSIDARVPPVLPRRRAEQVRLRGPAGRKPPCQGLLGGCQPEDPPCLPGLGRAEIVGAPWRALLGLLPCPLDGDRGALRAEGDVLHLEGCGTRQLARRAGAGTGGSGSAVVVLVTH
ncbi:hypothetical protein SMALA_2819 [Streptomyces malaysiensis subsp. malaysiensis]|nr:hypothetical protein SMALA_2819 [Streptomyces malaysiensis]